MMISLLIYSTLIGQNCEFRMQHKNAITKTVVEMSADKTITVRTIDPNDPDFPVQILRPGSTNYSAIKKMAGGIAPGERKTLPEFSGRVDMAADGTLTHSFWGTADNGAPLHGRATARPGDANYQKILSLVGPLKPGDWAMVKATPCRDQRP